MNFQQFSAALIKTQDLDPDYVYLRKILEDSEQFDKVLWAQHKVFIYDTASEYMYLLRNKPLDQLHYGAERRKNKRNTAQQLDKFISGFRLENMPKDYPGAREYLLQFPGMGDWAAWKFCDLLERVADIKIDFSQVDFRTAYKYPLKGLCRVNDESDDFIGKLSDNLTYETFMWSAQKKLGQIMDWQAPPHGGRTINIQEIETCLCKYHSYLGGHYKVGQDTLHLIQRFKAEGLEIPVDLTRYHLNPLEL